MDLLTVTNPGFEVDLSNWTLTDANASCTFTRDTTVTNFGSAGSAKLVNTAAGENDYIEHVYIAYNLKGKPGPYIVSAWVNVTVFTAGAFSNRGMHAYDDGAGGAPVDSLITGVTSGWERRFLVFILEPTASSIHLDLYSPQGTVYWDDIGVSSPSIGPDYSYFPRPIMRR